MSKTTKTPLRNHQHPPRLHVRHLDDALENPGVGHTLLCTLLLELGIDIFYMMGCVMVDFDGVLGDCGLVAGAGWL